MGTNENPTVIEVDIVVPEEPTDPTPDPTPENEDAGNDPITEDEAPE